MGRPVISCLIDDIQVSDTFCFYEALCLKTFNKVIVILYYLTQQTLIKTIQSTILMAQLSAVTVARLNMAAVLMEVPQPVDLTTKAVIRTKA